MLKTCTSAALRWTASTELIGLRAREAIALGLAQQGFASRFFKHGGRQGGILEIPGERLKGCSRCA